MTKKYGIQLRGLGRALKPKGPGVLRPKPTDRYGQQNTCLLYTSPSPRDRQKSRMPSSA